jgi:replicative DNA helicase
MNDTLANLEAEAELLGTLMMDNSSIDRVADILTAEDFYEPAHGRIYSAIVREASLGRASNPITLKGYFEADSHIQSLGGQGYLMNLTASTFGMVATDTAKQLIELATRRRMRAGLGTASEACGDLEVALGEIVSHADAAMSSSAKDAIHQPTAGECFDELIEGFRAKRDGVLCHQIPELDALLGPMRPKQLIIGAGRPGMGKTAAALSYAIGAAKAGHGVLFVSLEMSSVELAARMAADMCFDERGVTGVPYSAIRDGTLHASQERKVVEAGSQMHGLPLNVVDVGNLAIGRLNMLIRRHARRMAANGQKLELVIVDYLQLLSPDTKGRSNYEAVSEVSRALKAMAKDHGVAIFALAQLSREVEKRPDKRPQLSDLRDSGQIEQDADAVLFLLRPEYYLNQSEPEPGTKERPQWEADIAVARGRIEFILAKRRNGVTGSAVGDFHGAFQAVR